ncbi:hypothetical protein [Psychrobacter sp.]|uniref:hypothetical protein n=1 Tax=Psychrobacter sp. TaxID=56811 RepID=UPI0025E97C65|nr:hypothetical protein [Psychrobacter sp.]
MFDSMLTPLEKAKKIRELKSAILEAKSATGLSKARAIKAILDLRQQLGLKSSSPTNDQNDLAGKVAAFKKEADQLTNEPFNFDLDGYRQLRDEVDAANQDSLINTMDSILESYKQSLISMAIDTLKQKAA